jgi:tetratricopeptide (TPR) repeat protein
MRRVTWCFMLAVIAVSGVFAQSGELKRVFDEANHLYLEQKYDSAIVRYESILHNGYESGGLYFNMGNAYYKLGKIQNAILNYERAKKILPRDEDIQFNLQLANLQVTDKVDAVPELFVYRWMDAVLTLFSPAVMIWILYVLFLVTLGAFALYILAHYYVYKRYALWLGIVCLLLLILGITNFLIRSYREENTKYAIVMADVANIKAAPDSKGNDVFVIHRGLKIQVLDAVNNWRKIRLADGKIGWIQENDAESI